MEATEAIPETTEPTPTGEAKYVVFDTESNGLFKFKDKETGKSVPADADGQPRLAAVAFIIADETGQPLGRIKRYVKPDGWSMLDHGTEASDINGLTDDFLADHGVPVTDVLDLWDEFVNKGLIAAAYNAQHDCKHMRAELRRAGRDDRFEQTPNTCLMRAMKAYKGHPGLALNSFGTCKLRVAAEFFELGNFDWHQVDADAEAALLVLQRLIADGNVIEPKVHYAKNVT